MSDNKKDMTRIEDMGEFLHQLQDEAVTSFEVDAPPALPHSDDENAQEQEESFAQFNVEAPPEVPEGTEENINNEESTEEETSFSSETDFGSSDFSSNHDFSSTDEESPSFETSEEVASDFGQSFESNAEFDQETADFTTETSEEETSTFGSDDFANDAQTESMTEDFAPIEPESTEENHTDDFNNLVQETMDSIPPQTDHLVSAALAGMESLKEIRQFGEKVTIGENTGECNPAFSLVVSQVKFLEDIDEIIDVLKGLELLPDGEESARRALERGQLLIPRISEFAATWVSFKLRRFDLNLRMGLSDHIHPPRNTEQSQGQAISRRSLWQNQTHQFKFRDGELEAKNIILATTPSLDGHSISRYLGVAAEHAYLDAMQVEDEGNQDVQKTYEELAQKLKGHALTQKANAVVGITYQLTPLPADYGNQHKYKLTCTGNLVWAQRL